MCRRNYQKIVISMKKIISRFLSQLYWVQLTSVYELWSDQNMNSAYIQTITPGDWLYIQHY